MEELSIFIDESGDFGEYSPLSPYYIVSMVFHNQRIDLTAEINHLEQTLSELGLSSHCVHAGPIIRKEEEYRYLNLDKRQKILKRVMSFIRKADISFKCVYIEKKHISDTVEAAGKLSKQIASVVREHYSFFLLFDKIKIYYDNGQIELTKILSSVL